MIIGKYITKVRMHSAVSLPLENSVITMANIITLVVVTVSLSNALPFSPLENMQTSENELCTLQAKECAYPDLTHIKNPLYSSSMPVQRRQNNLKCIN